MTSYGFLLFDDAEELDFVGPWEVITASSMLRVRAVSYTHLTLPTSDLV